MEKNKSTLISTATVKTVAVLIAKSYIVIGLSIIAILIFFTLSGSLSFQSINTFKFTNCSNDIVSKFHEYSNISFSFSDREEDLPSELIYTIQGLKISENHYLDLGRVSKLLSENNCKISSVKLERSHILSSNSISDIATVIWLLMSSLLIALIFRKSIQNNRSLHKKLYFALPLFGISWAVLAAIIINLYLIIDSNSSEIYHVDSILARISFLEAFFIGVLFIPLFEEIIFRRIVFQFWINKNFVVLGILFSSLVFATMHALIPQDILPEWLVFFIIFFLSAGCCYAYLRTGLRGSWLFHSSYNASLIIPLYLFS